MLVTTWNIRGYSLTKGTAICELLGTSDLVCLTETWRDIPPDNDWDVASAVAKPGSDKATAGSGGVAILFSPFTPFNHRKSVVTNKYQYVYGTLFGVPIVGCYVSPTLGAKAFGTLLEELNTLLRGPGVLLGDLNARSAQWDDSTNARGPVLRSWAVRHNFRTQRPPAPTCRNASGSSRVDLILARTSAAPVISVGPRTAHSDHAATMGILTFATPASFDYIPLSYITNPALQNRIRTEYRRTLPKRIEAICKANTPHDLEQECVRLTWAITEPWARLCRPRPHRFRPGWTRTLDFMAKRRTALMRSSNHADKAAAQILNKRIKRTFRRNVRELRKKLGDEMASSSPGRQSQMLKSAIALGAKRDVDPAQVNPDEFTSFMAQLQPTPREAPTVKPIPFNVPPSFRQALLNALLRLKKKKSPGPDRIRAEILFILPSTFADAAMAVWEAVGRTAHVPSILRSGLLSPIYKDNGDPSKPTNNRPVCLCSALRRLIAAALTAELCTHYVDPHAFQWGYRPGTSTEAAICFAVGRMRTGLPHAVLLDIKKAFDCVPRQFLQKLLDKRLPAGLSAALRPLLWPMLLRTKGQTSADSILTLAGMPQGDATSPYLFSIFMDTYAEQLNGDPRSRLVSLFVDDVTGLAKSLDEMQHLLNESYDWASRTGMSWALPKCFGISLPSPVQIAGHTLASKDEGIILGVSLGARGVTHTKLLARLDAGRRMMFLIRTATRRWKTTLRQRRSFVKSFVFSITDYLAFLQPLTTNVREKAAALDKLCLGYVLDTQIRPGQEQRGRCLGKVLSFEARRRRQRATTVGRLYSRTLADSCTPHDSHAWNVLAHYSTVRPLLRAAPLPTRAEDVPNWTATQVRMAEESDWHTETKFKRQIPTGPRLPHIFRARLSPTIERQAIRWYLNRLRGCTALSIATPRLHTLLGAQWMNAAEIQQAEQLLYSVLL